MLLKYCLVTKARMSDIDNFALELFSGIGGMSLGLHSAGFESHGFKQETATNEIFYFVLSRKSS